MYGSASRIRAFWAAILSRSAGRWAEVSERARPASIGAASGTMLPHGAPSPGPARPHGAYGAPSKKGGACGRLRRPARGTCPRADGGTCHRLERPCDAKAPRGPRPAGLCPTGRDFRQPSFRARDTSRHTDALKSVLGTPQGKAAKLVPPAGSVAFVDLLKSQTGTNAQPWNAPSPTVRKNFLTLDPRYSGVLCTFVHQGIQMP